MQTSSSDPNVPHSTSEKQIQLQENSLLLNQTLFQLKNRHHHQNRTQRLSLDNNLSTFKQIQDYRKISDNLNLIQQLNKANSQKLQNIHKKVSNLNFLHQLSSKETLKLQHKKKKLQQTQSMAQFLHHLKQRNQEHNQQKQYERKQQCLSLRESNIHNRSFSQSVHHIVKEERIRQFKQANSKLMENYERNIEELLESNRKKAHETRMSELRLKEKLRKYQQYKIYVGRLNYEKKLQNEYRNHVENKRYLREVESKLKQQDKLFRKTQKLKKESKKIQDFYLTGTGAE